MGGEGLCSSHSTVSLLLLVPNLAPAGKPPSGLSLPSLAEKQADSPRWGEQS